MARGVNKAILVGHLGNDPDTKNTQGGLTICTISLATTSVRKDRDGNKVEETQWHRVVFFGKLAEIADEYLRKGALIYVEGSIKYETYEKDGETKYTTKIIGDQLQMLGGKSDNDREQQSGQRPASGRTQRPARNAAPKPEQQEAFDDSDIPF